MRVRTWAASLIGTAALGYIGSAGSALLSWATTESADSELRGNTLVVTHDPAGEDTGTNEHLNREIAILINRSDKALSLTGWTLRDKFTDRNVYLFSPTMLRPGRSVTVHTGSGEDRRGHRYWGLDFYVWDNGGDRIVLRDATGDTMDLCSFQYQDADGTDGCNHRVTPPAPLMIEARLIRYAADG